MFIASTVIFPLICPIFINTLPAVFSANIILLIVLQGTHLLLKEQMLLH